MPGLTSSIISQTVNTIFRITDMRRALLPLHSYAVGADNYYVKRTHVHVCIIFSGTFKMSLKLLALWTFTTQQYWIWIDVSCSTHWNVPLNTEKNDKNIIINTFRVISRHLNYCETKAPKTRSVMTNCVLWSTVDYLFWTMIWSK